MSDILIRLRNCLTPGHPYGANGADKVLRDAVEWIEKLERENLELRHDIERVLATHRAHLNYDSATARPPLPTKDCF